MKNSQSEFLLQLLALLKNSCNQNRLLLLVLITGALFGCGTGSGPNSITDSVAASVTDPATGKTLNLIWSDEFNGTTLDTAKWNYETGYGDNGWGNDEWELYTGSRNNVKVENGNLVITARCDSGNCGKRDGTTTSARITTKGKFFTKYGIIQARIKIPSGKGTWPAFWMLGTNQNIVGWPKCGEIDIMESSKFDAADKTTHSTVHWYDQTLVNGAPKGWTYSTGSKTFAESLGNDYHVYEVEWNADRIIGKIDGTTYFTKTIDPATMEEFLQNFYLIFNVAVGGNLAEAPNTPGATWPQSMYVDWVRVYGSAPFTATESTNNAGLFSETYTDPVVPYSKIINLADWSANGAATYDKSTDVTPKDGRYVMSATFSDLGQFWGGFYFDLSSAGVGVADYKAFNFSLDTSKAANFKDVTVYFEHAALATRDYPNKVEVKLSSFPPTVSGNWATYQIPFSALKAVNPGLDLSHIKYLGFINATSMSSPYFEGTIYFDDLNFGTTYSRYVRFAEASYPANSTSATISVTDPVAAGTTKEVIISNGTNSISVNVAVGSTGSGTATVNFGTTNDSTDTISIVALGGSGSLTASYTDTSGTTKSATAPITAVPSSIAFSAASIPANETSTSLTVTDTASAGTTKTVTISNGSASKSVNVFVGPAGSGSTFVQFPTTVAIAQGDTLTATFTDSASVIKTGTASIAAADTRKYIYPAGAASFLLTTDYTVDAWGSGTTWDLTFAGDATFSPVMKLTPGTGSGAWGTARAYIFKKDGFASSFTYLCFKYKEPTPTSSQIRVQVATKELTYLLSSATKLGNGWYEFTIPLSDFNNKATANQFAIYPHINDLNPTPLPSTPIPVPIVYMTDLYFK